MIKRIIGIIIMVVLIIVILRFAYDWWVWYLGTF